MSRCHLALFIRPSSDIQGSFVLSRSMFVSISLALALFLPLTANAGCDLDYQLCSKSCAIKHISGDGAQAACDTKCVASKGVCFAEVGADETAKFSKKAWNNAKSFIEEMSK